MADFLLIHGSCHGAWCWRDTIPALEALGHRARAIDLPSHGEDKTPLEDVTLDTYAEAIVDALDHRSIVVAHSMAGYPVSRAAVMAPSKFARLVYLCAYVPWRGMGLVEMRQKAPRQPILKALAKSEDGKSFSVIPEQAREVFYHDCSDEAVEYALARLCPQAILPQTTPVALGMGYDSISRSYIVCEEDSAIPTEFQREMAADFAPGDIYSLPTSHSPFFSAPDKLAECLDRIAKG